jgi:hypothetical protein
VNTKELESFLKKFSSKAYDLAFSLVPDDLQATQIVVDASTSFILSEKEWLYSLKFSGMTKLEEAELNKDLCIYLMKSVFSLALIRFSQLPNLNSNSNAKFFQLDGKTRAIIFLKYKENFSITEIMEITNLQKSEVMSRLFQGTDILGEAPLTKPRELPPELPKELSSF